MAYRNTRPESPKGRVYLAFASGGADKASSVAKELGVDNKLERWLIEFGEQPDQTEPRAQQKVVKHEEKLPDKIDTRGPSALGYKQRVLRKGMRVRLVGQKGGTMKGRLVDIGGQASGVHWDNFITQYHNNQHLDPL